MADLRVKLSDGSASEVIELVDKAGPLNEWKARASDILGPNIRDVFTNMSGSVVGRGCGATPCFILQGLDIDQAHTGDSGTGELNYIGSSIHAGSITWIVL